MLGMKATAIVGGVSLIVISMMALSIYFLNNKLEVANKEIGNLSGQVIGLKKDIETTEKLADNNKLHNEKFNILQNVTDERIQGLRNDFANQLSTGFNFSQESPDTFATTVHVDVARWMCRIQAATDSSAIQTCMDSPASAFEGDKSLTITITQDTAETYRLACENYRYWIIEATDDQREAKGSEYVDAVAKTYDTCRWSVTGYTVEGFYGLMMPYMLTVEKKLYDDALWIESVKAQLVDRENIASSANKEEKE